MTLVGHTLVTQDRHRGCCDNPGHKNTWVICSCGFEIDCGPSEHATQPATIAALAHRLDCLEKLTQNHYHGTGGRVLPG
jgi:hypothetical protein